MWPLRKLYYFIIREMVTCPYETIDVDPQNISYILLKSPQTTIDRTGSTIPNKHKIQKSGFRAKEEIGTILPGSWDEYKISQEHEIVHRGLKKVFKQNDQFIETEYGEIINIITSKDIGYGSYNSVEEHYNNKILKLYMNMERDGYLSAAELEKDIKKEWLHEVQINIGRNGELIANGNGHHRRSLAKILNVKRIPVTVVVRHQEWQKIRNEIKVANSYEELSSRSKNHIDHPDVPSKYKNFDQDTEFGGPGGDI